MTRHLKISEREKRIKTLIKIISAKVMELDPVHMKVVLITRHSTQSGKQVWDYWEQSPEHNPHRELVWRGKRGHPVGKDEAEFIPFTRREGNKGTALFLVTDTKHGEQHQLALIIGEDYQITGVRKEDLLGNDFYPRVSLQCKELSEIMKFDAQIWGLSNGDTDKVQ
ncbi:hypothetical protein ACRXCV_00070 (plasmid) [Halobacteriovorax sp. GFR7]|uniref:hypothetical protein n=1 Tax=unclassified Halobacteriovorax TaxID=2639665 RepID=UPI003D976C19